MSDEQIEAYFARNNVSLAERSEIQFLRLGRISRQVHDLAVAQERAAADSASGESARIAALCRSQHTAQSHRVDQTDPFEKLIDAVVRQSGLPDRRKE